MGTTIYSFYNNKGGVGKTTLCQNAASLFAANNPNKQVLVIDLCPQANISHFFLGGGHKGYKQNQKLQTQSTRKNIVGFMEWLLRGNSSFSTIRRSYAVRPSTYNSEISDNVYLIAGDQFLESLSLALNYAVINPANVKAWKEYMTAIKRLCELEFDSKNYDDLVVFIDCNPSFAIYTQMALVSSDYLIVPMMADYSSLEGIKGILTLLFGQYQSAAEKTYADNIITFTKKMREFNLDFPQFYEFVFNNFTSNVGVAKAFESVKNELVDFCHKQYINFPDYFVPPTNKVSTTKSWEKCYLANVKDFHTAGKVSASLGIPMHKLPNKSKYSMPDGELIQLPKANYQESLDHIISFSKKF